MSITPVIELFSSEKGKNDFVNTFKNPFKLDKVDKIEFEISKGMFDKNIILFTAYVRFVDGKTRGSHNIEADSFPELVAKVEAFIKTV